MGKSVHPIMGEGESVIGVNRCQIIHHNAASGQSKSSSALPDNNSSKKSCTLKERIRSALSLSSKSKRKVRKNADSILDSEDVKSSESDKASNRFSSYLMDMSLAQIQSYRPKEGTYGKQKSVRGFKKGVREFGELLLDMCLEDILAYQSDKSVRSLKKGVREFGELLLDMSLEDILAYRSV